MTEGIIKQFEIDRTFLVLQDVIAANIKDPLLGQAARSNTDHWIFEGFPNPADLGFAAPGGWKFPIIVIEYPNPDDEDITVDGSKQRISHSCIISTYGETCKIDGTTSVHGRRIANQLMDQIRHILTTTAQSELRKATLHGPMSKNGSPTEPDFIGGRKYYIKTEEFNFMRFD